MDDLEKAKKVIDKNLISAPNIIKNFGYWMHPDILSEENVRCNLEFIAAICQKIESDEAFAFIDVLHFDEKKEKWVNRFCEELQIFGWYPLPDLIISDLSSDD